MRKATEPRRIIVFRQGSIGDFVVSLPSFHLIRQSYPAAEIILLTNLPASESVMPAEAILDGTGLVDRYLKYPGGTRDPAELRELKAQLRAGPGDMLIYLAGAKRTLTTFRDYLFFRWCGLRAIVGIPANPQWMQSRPPISGGDLRKPSASRANWPASAGSIAASRGIGTCTFPMPRPRRRHGCLTKGYLGYGLAALRSWA